MYTWDYVMVFKVGDLAKKVTIRRESGDLRDHKYLLSEEEYFRDVTAEIVQRLRDAGLKTDLYQSVQGDEVYCRIAASEARND